MLTTRTRWGTPLGVLMLLAMLWTLPGCIVWEIRDQLVAVNESLVDVDEKLNTLEALEETNRKLATLQVQIESLQDQLEVLETIDASLSSVNTTLASLDRTLASILRIVRQIDGAIPFLRFTDDEEEPEADAPGDAQPDAGEPLPMDPAPGRR